MTWTAEGSPFSICQDVTIPDDATVVIEAGVTVTIDAGFHLNVQGTLLGEGTSGNPIIIDAANTGSKVRGFGHVELDWAQLDARFEPQDGGGAMIFRDCDFDATASAQINVISQPTYVWGNPPLVLLDRCTFTSDGSAYDFQVGISHVMLRDTSFTGTDVLINDSWVRLDGVSVEGGVLSLFFGNVDAHADVYVNNVSVTNNTDGAGLSVFGANALLGPDNVLAGNLYAVESRGLLPGSVVPTGGNTVNLIRANGGGPGSVWANLALPWLYDGAGCSAFPNIEPGTTLKMAPGALLCAQGYRMYVRGTPEEPITFEPLGGQWQGLVVHVSYGSILKHCVIDGAEFGLIATNGGARLIDSIVKNCQTGVNSNTFGVLQVAKTQFTNNATAATNTDTSAMWMEFPTRPNSFDGNTVAVAPNEFGAETDARFNWWGDPSGPTAGSNPGGTGDPIGGAGIVHYDPFLTEAPDYDDHPPSVRLKHNEHLPAHAVHGLFETGSKVIVEWSASDDGTIVEQQVLFSEAGDFDDDFTPVATLPADQRAFEWTVGDVPFIVNGASSYLRVVAVDDAGQEGFDQITMLVPSGDTTQDVTFTSDFGGMTFRSGQALPQITYTTPVGGTPYYYILIDGDERSIALGGGGNGSWNLTDAPFVSTDTARLAIRATNSLNDVHWSFGEYFSLRPDPAIGDAPPQVELLGPMPGGAYPGGATVPISWTASDDDGIGGFTIQASYDGGRTWHPLARDLPATATSYDWQLPPSTGIPDVRVRIVARDLHFQTTSDGGDGVFSITPGEGSTPGDVDGDGSVGTADLLSLLAAWGPCPGCPEDIDGDGEVGTSDLLILLASWT